MVLVCLCHSVSEGLADLVQSSLRVGGGRRVDKPATLTTYLFKFFLHFFLKWIVDSEEVKICV